MKEYFISEIDIKNIYHLSYIKIKLDLAKRQHLLLTGKNGSGKTSLLLRIVKYLQMISDEIDFENLEFYSDDLAEGYFDADAYSEELKKGLEQYEEFCFKKKPTEEACKAGRA